MDSHPDIAYRVRSSKLHTQYCSTGLIAKWHGKYKSVGGERGCFSNIQTARQSIAQYLPGTKYEIWKFHIGTVDSEIPYFPPEKVYEKL